MSSVNVAVEIGSGAVKVVIASPTGMERHRFSTDLFDGLNSDGDLSETACSRLDRALTSVARLLDDHGQSASRVVATHVLRAASDSAVESVTGLVADRLGTALEVLDGEAEAELGYRALSNIVGHPDHPLVTIDVGYGSTELATRLATGELCSISLPIGAGSVTADFLHSDPPHAAELSAALSVIELHLDDLVRERPGLAAAITDVDAEIVGTGITRHIAEVELGVADGDRIDGYRLERADAEDLFRSLATESAKDRAANPGLAAEHVPWIVGAMCVLLGFMRRFGVDRLRVATLDVADGLVVSDGSGAAEGGVVDDSPSPEIPGLGS